MATSTSETQFYGSASRVESVERRLIELQRENSELRTKIWKLEIRLDNLRFAMIMAAILVVEFGFFVALGLIGTN